MHDNNMAEAMDTFIHKVPADFKSSTMSINGVLVIDKNGLMLASDHVKNDCSEPIALLYDLASKLFQGSPTVCLENGDQKLIIGAVGKADEAGTAGKAVFSIYTEATRR